jgi:hypothetical protein
MKRVRKTEKVEGREGDRGITTKCQICVSFCVYLAATGDINDQPILVDQSR